MCSNCTGSASASTRDWEAWGQQGHSWVQDPRAKPVDELDKEPGTEDGGPNSRTWNHLNQPSNARTKPDKNLR